MQRLGNLLCRNDEAIEIAYELLRIEDFGKNCRKVVFYSSNTKENYCTISLIVHSNLYRAHPVPLVNFVHIVYKDAETILYVNDD